MAERVLITGARAAAALDLARAFRAVGWEPHLADCSAAWMARASTMPAAVHRYPSPVRDGAGFRQAITELADTIDARLVVPTCEEVFHLASPALTSVLGKRLFAPPLATLRRLHDKLAFARACAEWSLPVPESHPVQGPADLAPYTGESGEWVFKPRFSRFGEAALVGPTPAQLEHLPISPDQPWLAQRRLRGAEASFYAVAHGGVLRAFAAYRSDWRLRGGASFAFEPLDARKARVLRDIAGALAEAAELTGQFSCDAIFDAEGQAWLIECNPRATSGVHLLADDGSLARAILGEEGEAPVQITSPVYLAPAMVLFGLPSAIRGGSIGAWRQAMAHGRDALARRGDRLPLVGALADAAGFAVAGLRHGLTASAATTRDIEWNGEDLP